MSGVLSKIMPARTAREEPSIVVDLDDLVSKPVGFRFRGRVYRVEPVSAERFMTLSQELATVGALIGKASRGEEVHEAEIYAGYQKVISALCPEFTTDILREMSLPQIHGLLNLIIKHVTGQPMTAESGEKKKMTLPR